MKIINSIVFRSVTLTFGIIASSVLIVLLLVRLFPASSPYDLMLVSIDLSFLLFIFIGWRVLNSSRKLEGNLASTLFYFLIALLFCAFWFLYSPIVALNNKAWNINLHFSSKSLNEVINNPISFQSYRFFKLILIGPVLEEVFYRRIILNSMLQKYNVYFSILISSLLFSIGHMDFDYTIVFLVFGILIGTFYWKTGNLYLTVLLHIFINFLTVFFI